MNNPSDSAALPAQPGSKDDPAAEPLLDADEIRVLGVMAEKEALTPDNYPMSLNGLTNGCNQLTSREPVMALTEATVQEVLHRLQQKKFIAEVRQAGGRVPKYEHRMRIKWLLEQDKLAILTLLMLRGMQTAGEIRSRAGRLHDFSTLEQVETGLEFLMDKYPPLVARMTRAAGSKESRYMHLLAGQEALGKGEAAPESSSAAPVPEFLRQGRIEHLEQEVVQLRSQMERLTEQFDSFKKQFE